MAYTTINKSSDYFETLLSTGDGGSQTFTGLDFQPDFVWSKRRQTHAHQLYDSVRTAGSGKALQSESIATEGGDGGTYGYLSSFTSDGFASTAGSSNNNYFNASGGTYAFWNWKAGTAVSGNTGGSGTAKTYTGSVNTTSGFSIIKYTGNQTAGHTIPHHLGVAPSMILTKLISGDTSGWYAYHKSLGNTGNIFLNTTAAVSNSGAWWNSTTPTSSVFTLGDQTGNNSNSNPLIAYCFAEKQGYSKFGSYTGNGNADGTFIYTGFKPAFLIIKKTNAAKNWFLHDNKRLGYNPSNGYVNPNSNAAEYAGTDLDMVSNGFKMRSTGGGHNESGHTYIYMAFAEAPLVGTNNVPCTAR